MAKHGPTLSHLSDAEIIARIKASDQDGMRALLARHGPTVLDILTKRYGCHIAADAFNRAAFVVWADMSAKYREGEGTLLGWFLQIASHKALDIQRGEKHDKFVELDIDRDYDPTKCKDPDYDEEKAETLQWRMERNEAVRKIINNLSRKERIVTECDRDSAHDIAEFEVIRKALGDPNASRGSVDTARSRARATIRAEMIRLGYYPHGAGRRKMADENDQFWRDVKGKVRRAFNLNPLCREEAEELARRAKKDKRMSEQDIDAIMEYVLSWGQSGGLSATPEAKPQDDEEAPAWTDDPVTPELMDQELAVLNSNAGEKDPETEELIEKLRREALGDAEADDDTEDSSGLGDGKEPAGPGR